jgi:hypothetical protein
MRRPQRCAAALFEPTRRFDLDRYSSRPGQPKQCGDSDNHGTFSIVIMADISAKSVNFLSTLSHVCRAAIVVHLDPLSSNQEHSKQEEVWLFPCYHCQYYGYTRFGDRGRD